MSVRWTSYAWVDGPSKMVDAFVYISLCDNAAEDGYCYPSIRTISRRCRAAETTVKGAIRRLMREGWVERLEVGTGRNVSSYRVKVKSDANATEPPRDTALGRDAESTGGGGKRPPRTKVTRMNRGGRETPPRGAGDDPLGGVSAIPPTPPNRKNRHLTVRGTGSGSAASLPAQAPAQGPRSSRPPVGIAAKPAPRTAGASHRPPHRSAAKRNRPARASGERQTSLPLTTTTATPPRSVTAPVHPPVIPSRSVNFPPQDARFDLVANILRNEFWVQVNPQGASPCRWNNRDKAALSRLLRSWAASLEQIRVSLLYRALSIRLSHGHRAAVSASEPIADWIEELPGYSGGPINKFNDPLTQKEKF